MGGSPVGVGSVPTVTAVTLSSAVKASLFGIIAWRCLAQSEHGIARPRTWHALDHIRAANQWQPAHAVGLMIADALEFFGRMHLQCDILHRQDVVDCRPSGIVDVSMLVIVLNPPAADPLPIRAHPSPRALT